MLAEPVFADRSMLFGRRAFENQAEAVNSNRIVASPIFLLAPGAGAPSSSSWMRRWADLLGTIGAVRTFDYPYMIEGRKRPDPLPKLIASHREALRQLQDSHAGSAVLIGKSMGSRVGCHVSLEEEVTALVCLGYPLCGAGDPGNLRDKVLREIRAPILFVQGTRDPLCPLPLLERVRAEMVAPNDLHAVQGGDHSLRVTKSQLKATGQIQDDVDRHILQKIREFVEAYIAAREA
jgi:predicted alpha/beta-hydrolase family hydrolase